ncbi:MAG: aspartate--tRNA ligase [Chitinophagales bacterium]|nr:aspartate--tRNA ligase [Chitinophagales bacterium]
MYRTHNCGELSQANIGLKVKLSGWVQTNRDFGGMTFVDLRDRYGITQLVFNSETHPELSEKARKLGREFVLMVEGTVAERSNKNPKLSTGDIEIMVSSMNILNPSLTPPFTIEDESDGGDELRMKYRYLDLRRNPLQRNLMLRHRVNSEARIYLSQQGFIEVETPFLIKSTPEGARDFVVPSRMNAGQFYALPQSPQTFKQLLMVSGYDKYFQMVKCFRDEDLRADRQPEFSQIDCEMSFVTRDDVLNTFEGLAKHLFKTVVDVNFDNVPHMSYADAMYNYGSDKPDIRFGMKFVYLDDIVKGQGFNVFDSAESVIGVKAQGCASYTRKELDKLIEFVKRPQVGAKGLVYVKHNEDGTFKSSVDKFYDNEKLKSWGEKFDSKPGDLLLILAGDTEKTQTALNVLRLEMGERMGLRKADDFSLLWIVDFPLLEWSEDDERWVARHHPFTRPLEEDLHLIDSEPGKVRAAAYDLVLNGNEIAGGSIRIHERDLQEKMFEVLGLSEEEAEEKFGFLMGALQYGAPPHGGIAFGFDRLVALMGGSESIRDYIAFPKNNSGRDVMIDAPSPLDKDQLDELSLEVKKRESVQP